MFTFSFSTAFATGLSADEKDALNVAYSNLTVSTYAVNYDGAYDNRTSAFYSNLSDLTEFTISAAYMQKAVDEAYTAAVQAGTPLPGDPDLTGWDATDSNRANSVAVAQIKAGLLEAAKTTYLATAEKAAFDEYKAMLKGLVESIDLSAYTTTKKDVAYTAADGEEYYTAAEAAAADKAYLLALIDKAAFEEGASEAASATATWKTTYENLYDVLFEGTVADVEENKDDVLDTNLVTSLSYVLLGDYATTKSEAAADANDAAAKATALSKLTQAVTNYENSDAYSSKMDAGIAAYVEAKKYLIENGTLTGSETYNIILVEKVADGDYAVQCGDDAELVDYVDRCTIAAKVKAAQDTAKTNAAILGKYYDETEAAKQLKARLLAVYGGTSVDTTAPYSGENNLTAGSKAAAKIDLSDIEAQGDIAKYYEFEEKSYYEKEWEAVKSAVDTYNAAVDAATTQSDVDDARTALNKAIAKVSDKTTVDTAVSANTTEETIDQLAQYFALTKSTYNTTSGNSENIYINWGADWDNSVVEADVVEWFIAKGARTAKEAAALYKEATAVIDGFKSFSAAKTEAEAVKAQIAALPTTLTLADKDSVMAAYDAYKALPADVQVFVTNDATLKKAITSVHALERNSLVTSINALPAVSKVTVENKDAVKAVIDAYEAYDETEAYGDNVFTGLTKYTWNDLAAYKAAVKTADLEAIRDMYAPLQTKYSVDALTSKDAEAIAKLQAAIAAYIAEYNESPGTDIEYTTEKMAAVVAVDDEFAKAYLQNLSIKARSTKTSKGVKVTINADVQPLLDAGFTVEYKFYRSTKSNKNYGTAKITKTENTYLNTSGKKGTRYYYKAKIVVKNAAGEVVATTPLTQCLYATRVF